MIGVKVIGNFISGLDLSSPVLSFSDNAVNTTLFVRNVFNARAGLIVLVDAVEYTVVSVDYEANSLVVMGVIIAPVLYEVPTPFYWHGTFLKANGELNEILSIDSKVPMCYLHEVMRERLYPLTSGLERTCEVKLFLMDKAPQNGATTAEQYDDIITPLSNLAEAIRQQLYASPKFTDWGVITQVNEIEWGTYTDSKGHMKRFFDAQLTGIGLFFDLNILKCCI